MNMYTLYGLFSHCLVIPVGACVAMGTANCSSSRRTMSEAKCFPWARAKRMMELVYEAQDRQKLPAQITLLTIPYRLKI